jgi:hypothetical protein
VRIARAGEPGKNASKLYGRCRRDSKALFAKKTQSLATFARSLIAIANNDRSRQQSVQTNIVDGSVHRTTFPVARLSETFSDADRAREKRCFSERFADGLVAHGRGRRATGP